MVVSCPGLRLLRLVRPRQGTTRSRSAALLSGRASLRDTLKAEATRGSGRELRLVPCTDETPKGAPREEDTKNRRPAVPNWLSEAVVSSGQAWRWNGIDENYEVAGPHSRSRTLDRRGGSSRVGPSVRACK